MAVDELLDEHEQGERVREWIRQNAIGVIGGIAIALALVYGWGKWQDHLDGKRMAKGEAYAALDEAIAAGDLDKARAQAAAAGLNEGVYGTLIALDLAAAQVGAGESEAAIATLSGIKDADPALAPVVARRLAVLLVDAGRTDEALAALGNADDAGSLEVRGDAERAAGRLEQAREAYSAALAALDEAAVPQRSLLEIKLIDAGGSPDHDEAQAQ
ncbi:YfgM family protein [Luteimonas arsenica]|uniref:YfgM family protein n=1 Tax=Luteimonas arsenica TaxID=1586242 RepID=UPI0010542265|nr:tetratricopeptide repeat protein [Luteimonas arsenica]